MGISTLFKSPSRRDRKMKLTPFPHQVEAYSAIKNELKINNRTTVSMACGTGKTKLQTMLVDLVNPNKGAVIVFAPTLLLINQLLTVWVEETDISFKNFVVICSDKKTGILDDIDLAEIEETSVKVAKTEKEINAFYKASSGVTVAFCTYNSSELLKNWEFDLGIFDEAHKTVGQVDRLFSYAMNDENIKITNRVFMTATRKNAHHKTLSVYSMSDAQDYGNTAYDLSFRRAIDLGLILDYKILITVITKQELSKTLLKKNSQSGFDLSHYANSIAIQKAIENYNLHKIITFHNTIENAEIFSKVLEKEGSFDVVTVSSQQRKDIRAKNMAIFKNSKNAVATNAQCLTEGIDVPEVDAVFFANDKSSIIDIVQAAGRTMRKSTGKEMGYIILPIYLELYNESSFAESVKDQQFEIVWSTLNALSEVDETLEVVNTNLFNNLGRIHKYPDLSNKIEVVSDLQFDHKLFMEALSIEAANNFVEDFDFRIKQLDKYVMELGHGFIPKDFHDKSFAYWAEWMRKSFAKKQLPLHKINRLKDSGFVFNYHDFLWNETFKKYKEEREKVSSDYDISDPNIKVWLTNQRARLKDSSYLNDSVFLERLEKLKSAGFDARTVDEKWNDIYLRVKQAALDAGGIENINHKDIANYGWLNAQRKRFKSLSPYQQELLTDIGFNKILVKPSKSDLALIKWNEVFERVNKACEKFGGIANIPSTNHADYAWIKHQHKNWYKLNEEQKQKLNSIGFKV